MRQLADGCGEYGDVVLFLANTGLRRGEMAALGVGRLDMLSRRINVAEAVSPARGLLVWSSPKSYSSRSVPFPEFLSETPDVYADLFDDDLDAVAAALNVGATESVVGKSVGRNRNSTSGLSPKPPKNPGITW